MTNQFGEFHFGFQSVQHMQLFFGMQQKALVVPLPQGQTEGVCLRRGEPLNKAWFEATTEGGTITMKCKTGSCVDCSRV